MTATDWGRRLRPSAEQFTARRWHQFMTVAALAIGAASAADFVDAAASGEVGAALGALMLTAFALGSAGTLHSGGPGWHGRWHRPALAECSRGVRTAIAEDRVTVRIEPGVILIDNED